MIDIYHLTKKLSISTMSSYKLFIKNGGIKRLCLSRNHLNPIVQAVR